MNRYYFELYIYIYSIVLPLASCHFFLFKCIDGPGLGQKDQQKAVKLMGWDFTFNPPVN